METQMRSLGNALETLSYIVERVVKKLNIEQAVYETIKEIKVEDKFEKI